VDLVRERAGKEGEERERERKKRKKRSARAEKKTPTLFFDFFSLGSRLFCSKIATTTSLSLSKKKP
jgi:hypothetical protein